MRFIWTIGLGAAFAATAAGFGVLLASPPGETAESTAARSGEAVYSRSCATCHGEGRLGLLAPPLLPGTLTHFNREQIRTIITRGVAGTRMEPVKLEPAEVESVIDFILTEKTVTWTPEQISSSRVAHPDAEAPPLASDLADVTAIVERGTGDVLFLEGTALRRRIHFPNVHGGLKFLGDRVYIPARTGFVTRVGLAAMREEVTARVGVYLRNIDVGEDVIVAAVGVPPMLAWLDHDLRLLRTQELADEPSSVIRYDAGRWLVSFLRSPRLLLVDRDGGTQEFATKSPYQQTAIVEGLVIGTNGRQIFATDMRKEIVVEDDAIPHVAAGDFWRDGDAVLWATPKIKASGVSVYRITGIGADVRMQQIAHVEAKALDVRGHSNTFVRTHPNLDVVVTTAGNEVLVVSKKDWSIVRRLTPEPGRMPLHTEFTKDGSILFVSVYHEFGSIRMYDTKTWEPVGSLPAVKPAGQYNRTMKTTRIVRSGG